MLDTFTLCTHFPLDTRRYPIGVAAFLDQGRPHSVQLLGKDYVLWHDSEQWRVFDDAW